MQRPGPSPRWCKRCVRHLLRGCGRLRDVGHIAGRAEEIAAFLVAAIVGAEATRQGPSSSMDFDLRWPNGDPGVLEVTLVPHSEAIRWQDQLATAGGGWDVPGRWELRLHTLAMPYRATEEAARRVVDLCDEHGVDHPGDLPAGVRAAEPSVAHMEASDRSGEPTLAAMACRSSFRAAPSSLTRPTATSRWFLSNGCWTSSMSVVT